MQLFTQAVTASLRSISKELKKMVYNVFQNEKLSSLGLGAMRLPCVNGSDTQPDQAAVDMMTDEAIKGGINYFDTAWGYHGGQSETVLGKSLSRYDRKSYYLADKFPGYDLANMTKVEEIFNKQLKKCQTDYFDFYLFHNVCEKNIDGYLNPEYGIYDYLIKMKNEGKIKHLGFSIHGDENVLNRFLDAYGESMEFCQIQLNFIDYEFQKAKTKIEILGKHNIPVWVMEPLRGGRLAVLPEKYEAMLKEKRPDETVPAWSFRFLQTIPSVTVVLSGMSNMQQLKDNIATMSTFEPLQSDELSTLDTIAKEMTATKTLPCTGCHYCTTHCPQELDIPMLISMYNEHSFTGGGFITPFRISALPEDKKPSACIGCRSCEAVCPQNIKISEMMSDFAEKLK